MSIFALDKPIIQAPMLGASSRAMALATIEAGGLGSLALAGSSPDAIKREVAEMVALLSTPMDGIESNQGKLEKSDKNLKKTQKNRNFAVNLFVLPPPFLPDEGEIAHAVEQLQPYRQTLGLGEQVLPKRWGESFLDQLDAVIEAAPPFASFTFGILEPSQCERLHARGTKIIGTATSVAEAQAWYAVGADAIVAQGMEAGGHRGTFLRPVGESLVGIAALLPAIKAAIPLPVIAAGGVMDGRSIAAMLMLGADAVQMGTALLWAEESLISPAWRTALVDKNADDTALTRAFSGRYARGIANRFMQEMADKNVPPYPMQNILTQEIRQQAARIGEADWLSLWAGQGVHALRKGRTEDLIHDFWQETQDAMRLLLDQYKT